MKPTITIIVLLVERFEPPKIWKLEIPAEMSPEASADYVFELSNAPPQFLTETQREVLEKFPRTNLRSVSVGDVIIIEKPDSDFRHIATVERMGFNFH